VQTHDALRFAPGKSMLFGFGHECAQSYEWHGMKRGKPRHPFVVCQFTVEGFGEFESRGRRERLDPGSVFAAIVPGDHVYRLPPESQSWSHFWFITTHAWVVERTRSFAGPDGLVLMCDDAVLELAASLFERACVGKFLDDIDWEMSTLQMIGALERLERARRERDSVATELLDTTRRFTLESLPAAADVGSLAEAVGLSRSAFSHQFRRETGQTPAAFMTEVRLAEVRRFLRSSDEPLKAIARQTGFADANHLCKVFRRHHGISPGEFRG
jgi:AraC-like DNA-binding protein